MEQPNIASLGNHLMSNLGQSAGSMKRMLRSFNGFLEPFKQASDHYERLEQRTIALTRRRTIRVAALARVEGEGALHLEMDGDRVSQVRLEIYEPPRFYEAFLRGRSYTEVPDITATDLRHLSRRVPDGILPRFGKGVGRLSTDRSCHPHAAKSALLRRVD